MRLINADEMKDELKDMDFVITKHNLEDWIDEQPTVDAEPVRHGKWLADYDCGEFVLSCSLCDEHYWIEDIGFVYDKPKFCPNCGAKMDLGEGEEK